MNSQTLARLDVLAAAREMQLLETVRRQQAALAQVDDQRGILAAYRTRLAQSWQSGAVVAAAQALRAEVFTAAAAGASAQIGQAGALAGDRLAAALEILAQVQAQRRRLTRLRQRNGLLAAREDERRAEAALLWRHKTLDVEGPDGR
jgi:hypothetical protein